MVMDEECSSLTKVGGFMLVTFSVTAIRSPWRISGSSSWQPPRTGACLSCTGEQFRERGGYQGLGR
jgi:hypothetical protein